jgi:hypothetical protein
MVGIGPGAHVWGVVLRVYYGDSMTRSPLEDEKWQGEARGLKEAGWEPRGEGAKTIWRHPSTGHWYAHHEAVVMLRKENERP